MTTPTVPSPADLPRAGLSLTEALRRHEALHGDGTGRSDLTELADAIEAMPHAVDGALAHLVADPDESASHEPVPVDVGAAYLAALRDEPSPASPKPQPPFGWVPGVARQPNPMARDQYVRRAGLELAVKHFQDLEVEPGEVLATAKTWAEWIRTGL